MTIMLHEILKLLYYAGAKDPIVIRIGTSGGIGQILETRAMLCNVMQCYAMLCC